MRSHVSQLADLDFQPLLPPRARFPLALIACHIESSQFSSSRNIWVNGTDGIYRYQFSFEDWAGCCILKTLGLRLVTLGSARLDARERPEHWWHRAGSCRAMTVLEVAWPKSGLNWLNCCRVVCKEIRKGAVVSGSEWTQIWHGDAGTTSKVQQLGLQRHLCPE